MLVRPGGVRSLSNALRAGRLLLSGAADNAPCCSGREVSTGSEVSAEAFHQNPKEAARALATQLSPAQRAILAAALAQHTQAQHLDEKYFEELFQAHDTEQDSKGVLTRAEFQQALIAHASFTESKSRQSPSSDALKMVFLASALPFIGFGFLDNAIMLVAGEEIDHIFGAKLGLSTLASAGLGNTLADVIGVGAAKYIEQAARRLPFIKDPKLSKHQSALAVTQRAKLMGATLGVLCGCLLGLTPLFAAGTFFTLS